MLHSQRIREKPLIPWVIAEKDGRILAGHCDCMAGLGEVCTHVAALLFTVEAAVKVREATTVTEDKAYWLLPTAVRNSDFKECREIDFTSTKTLKKRPYSGEFVPKSMAEVYPIVLSDLRDEGSVHMNYAELVAYCRHIDMSVSAEQPISVEKATLEQAKSKKWFRFQAGRITAFKMKAVCRTDPTQPALSLINSICYSLSFTSKYTTWGCQHEKYACQICEARMSASHEDFRVQDVGFFINPDFPFLGASPHGFTSCNYCGTSTLEVKCPFCTRHECLNGDKKVYLNKNDNGSLVLDRTHAYYYQVETQLEVCTLESGYFFVWTENDLHSEQSIFDHNL